MSKSINEVNKTVGLLIKSVILHFLLEIIIIKGSSKTRLLLRDKYKVVHSEPLYRPLLYM